jgi:hypothetical protein
MGVYKTITEEVGRRNKEKDQSNLMSKDRNPVSFSKGI